MKNRKNKKVVLASAIVLGITAITSSALAAYIITGGENSGTKNIDPSNIDIQNKVTSLTVAYIQGELLFQPLTAVTEGRVKTDKNGNLTVTVPLTMNAKEKKFIPDLKWEVTATGSAVSDNYVTVPEMETPIISGNWSEGTPAGQGKPEGTYDFTYNLVLTFGFGSAFDGSTDPAAYYNTGAGKDTEASAVVKALEAFATSVNATTFTVTINLADTAEAA